MLTAKKETRNDIIKALQELIREAFIYGFDEGKKNPDLEAAATFETWLKKNTN